MPATSVGGDKERKPDFNKLSLKKCLMFFDHPLYTGKGLLGNLFKTIINALGAGDEIFFHKENLLKTSAFITKIDDSYDKNEEKAKLGTTKMLWCLGHIFFSSISLFYNKIYTKIPFQGGPQNGYSYNMFQMYSSGTFKAKQIKESTEETLIDESFYYYAW